MSKNTGGRWRTYRHTFYLQGTWCFGIKTLVRVGSGIVIVVVRDTCPSFTNSHLK
jgi:hypothetical protein